MASYFMNSRVTVFILYLNFLSQLLDLADSSVTDTDFLILRLQFHSLHYYTFNKMTKYIKLLQILTQRDIIVIMQ